VINRDRPDYVKSWEEFEFLPGALEALRQLAAKPQWVIVVSNQSCVGRGLMTRQAMDEIHDLMKKSVRRAGGRIDAVYVCPHRREDNCACRKPRPGLILDAAQTFAINLRASRLIGDDLRDLECAAAAGVQPVLVRSGHGRDLAPNLLDGLPFSFRVFEDLLDAAIHLNDGDW
jgi:D-glycero-D-manno-heptose 1,7-bisphosphate phosphatase